RFHGFSDGDLGQRLDEPPNRLPAQPRHRRRRASIESAVWQQLFLARADPHVPRRVHRHRLLARGRLRGRAAARTLRPLRAHRPNASVQGLAAVPPARRPPVTVVRVAFQTMVGIGTLLALLSFAYLAVRVRRRRLPESRWFYRALAAAGPLSVVALICGWVTTEVGRQPWVVYRVMRTSEPVTGA